MNIWLGILIGIGGFALAIMAGIALYQERPSRRREALRPKAAEPGTT
jgi:hypothetical protein